MIRIGIDLGGTKIEILAMGEQGEDLYRQRVATPAGDYDKTLQAMVDLVGNACETLNISKGDYRLGIATPGAVSSKTGRIKNSNSVCLNGMPLVEDLQSRLGHELNISNDANCFALSEATDGNAVDASIVFGVIVGTGTGAGIVVNGIILEGANAIAGEWGHNPLPWPDKDELPGPTCYCGKQGCIETYLSGPGMALDHESKSGEKLQAEQIVERAAQGDEKCEATLQRYENRMARSLAHVINIIDPDVIVLGGGMSNIKRLYLNVPRLWGKYVFSDEVKTRLIMPKYGDASGVRGAAML